jgi:hypothetical protein
LEDAKSISLQTTSRGKQVFIVAAMVASLVVLFIIYRLLTKTAATTTPPDEITSPPVVASLLESIPTVELPQLPQLLWAENSSSTQSLVE